MKPVSGANHSNFMSLENHNSAAYFATHSTSTVLQRASSFGEQLRLISCRAVKRLLLALIWGWLLAPRCAQAKDEQSASARLEVIKGAGSERCLDGPSLSRAVESRLQRRAFRSDVPATLYVKIAVAHDAAGWSALLTMRDGTGAFLGRRSLVTEAADCSALDDSLALVVALLVDSPPAPVAEDEEPAPTGSPPSQAAPKNTPGEASSAPVPKLEAPEPARHVASIRLPRDTPAAREPWRHQLAAEAVFALGILPGFAPGVELGFGAKAPRMPELRLFAGWFAPREQRRADRDAGARFDALYLGLEVCPFEHLAGIAQWSFCAGQAVGRIRSAAFGFDENSTSNHLTYAILARGALQLGLSSHWSLRLGIRAELPLVRGSFRYGTPDGSQPELYQPSPVAAVLDLGLIVRL